MPTESLPRSRGSWCEVPDEVPEHSEVLSVLSTDKERDLIRPSVRTNVIKLRIVENELSKRRLIFVFMVLTKCEKCAARFRCSKDLEMRKRAL